MKRVNRRTVLHYSVAAGAPLAAGCGGGTAESSTTDSATPAVADTREQAQGLNSGTGAIGGTGTTLPLSVQFDAEAPEQISLHCPLLRPVAEGTSVRVRYRPATASIWRTAQPLLRVRASEVNRAAPQAVVDAFAGAIFDLRPGTTYMVELYVYEPGGPTSMAYATRATRTLPAPSRAATRRVSPGADLGAAINALRPGDVLELGNGTYSVGSGYGIQPNVSGTSSAPIVVRGASRDGVVIHAPAGIAVQFLRCSHFILENLTIRGSGVDSGTDSTSVGIAFNNNSGTQTNVTIRHVTFTGVDKGIKAYARIDGCLVYGCILRGNNTWDKAYTINPASGQPNLTWNDDGISLPGTGNAAWNNTLSGFGDAFSVIQEVFSAAVYYWRNRIEMTGDDAFEADHATRNVGFYDNYIANCATLLSLDPLYGGPLYAFRNIAINTIRGPFKWTNTNAGQLVYNNTILRTDGSTGIGWSQANNGTQSGWSFRNNLLVYRGSGSSTLHLNMGAERLDFTHNAWFPDRAFNWPPTGGGFASLAAARAGLPSKTTLFGSAQRHSSDVIVASNPWRSTITIGTDHTSAYTAMQVPALDPASSAAASGVAIPNVTDGFVGAAPDRGAIITGRAVPLFGAILAPSWATNATPGTWTTVPMATTLAAVDPIANPAHNPNFPNAPEWAESTARQRMIVDAWCGAAFDDSADTMWLGLGGGHRDYAGNEVYRCDFFAEQPAWRMVRAPSGAVGNLLTTNDGREAAGLYSDGRPRATHTYNKWAYVPGVGPVLAGHGHNSWSGANGKRWAVFLDEANGEATFSSEPTLFNLNQTDGLATAYDPTRRALWIVPGNTGPMVRYDMPAGRGANTGTYSAVGASFVRFGGNSACYLLGHDCLLIGTSTWDGTQGRWLVFDCANGQVFSPVFNGVAAIGNFQGSCQPRWVPALGAAALWDNATNTTRITTLTPGANPRTDPWTVSTLAVAPGNSTTPSPRTANGTFGRFAYSQRLGGFLLFNSTNGPTWFFKL